MNYPEFFESTETITLQDKLSMALGAFDKGLITYCYLDVVKNAGHSCPTIAGAYLMAREGIKALYGKELPQRGEMNVFFKESIDEGTTGVVANVFSLITGATNEWGFKGLNGKFSRKDLMFFNAPIPLHVRIQRRDTGASVDVAYNPDSIKQSPLMQPLMQKVLSGVAKEEETKQFGVLWQERIGKILENFDKVILLK